MLCKARKVLPRDACLTLFNIMVLPIFDYCCVVWDACAQGNKNFFDGLYHRAASIIEGRKVTQNELGTVFKWRSLQRRQDYHKCLQVYKCLIGLAPMYLLDNFEKFNQIHSYDTRNKDLLRLPLAKTTKFQTVFKFNAAKTWNSLPSYIRHCHSITSFKHDTKQPFT